MRGASADAADSLIMALLNPLQDRVPSHRSASATVMDDPKLEESMDPAKMPFDGKRMFWGGFRGGVDGSVPVQCRIRYPKGRKCFPQCGQLLGASRRVCRNVISAVTIPVGTASTPQPRSIMIVAITRLSGVCGVMSPKPTVVIVVTDQ